MALQTGQVISSTFAPTSQPSPCRAVPRICSPASFRKMKLSPASRVRACSALRNGVQKDERAAKLKEELFRAMEEAKDVLDERCLAAVASLEQLAQVPDITAHPHLLKGCFVGLKSNFKENRMDGKQRYLGFKGSPTTLGATTFNALKPPDLRILLYTGQQQVAMESPDSYVLLVDVDIVSPSGDEPLLGQIANKARFTISSASSLEIEFVSAEIKPRSSEVDLAAWLQVFKDANPDMDDHGFVSVCHRKPIKGRTDILYMDDKIRIHRGNKGGVSVLRVLEAPM